MQDIDACLGPGSVARATEDATLTYHPLQGPRASGRASGSRQERDAKGVRYGEEEVEDRGELRMREISARFGMLCMMVRPCSDLRLFSWIIRIRLATCNAAPPWKSVCALLSLERGVVLPER